MPPTNIAPVQLDMLVQTLSAFEPPATAFNGAGKWLFSIVRLDMIVQKQKAFEPPVTAFKGA
jgi:hypothetical protein